MASAYYGGYLGFPRPKPAGTLLPMSARLAAATARDATSVPLDQFLGTYAAETPINTTIAGFVTFTSTQIDQAFFQLVGNSSTAVGGTASHCVVLKKSGLYYCSFTCSTSVGGGGSLNMIFSPNGPSSFYNSFTSPSLTSNATAGNINRSQTDFVGWLPANTAIRFAASSTFASDCNAIVTALNISD